jgi:hypothetical protein
MGMSIPIDPRLADRVEGCFWKYSDVEVADYVDADIEAFEAHFDKLLGEFFREKFPNCPLSVNGTNVSNPQVVFNPDSDDISFWLLKTDCGSKTYTCEFWDEVRPNRPKSDGSVDIKPAPQANATQAIVLDRCYSGNGPTTIQEFANKILEAGYSLPSTWNAEWNQSEWDETTNRAAFRADEAGVTGEAIADCGSWDYHVEYKCGEYSKPDWRVYGGGGSDNDLALCENGCFKGTVC